MCSATSWKTTRPRGGVTAARLSRERYGRAKGGVSAPARRRFNYEQGWRQPGGVLGAVQVAPFTIVAAGVMVLPVVLMVVR